MNPREFFDRYIRGWFPAEPKMQRHWPVKPIATIVVVSISFSIIISLLSSFFFASSAIVAISQWKRTYGLENNDEHGRSLVVTSDGGYAIAGYTMSFGAGGCDFWLIKTDAYGNMEWNQTYGGAANDVAFSLVVTSDGGYAMAGYTTSFGFDPAVFWLVKTDSFGNMEWNQTYEGLRAMLGKCSLVATSDGGYAIGGGIWQPMDVCLIKTDAYGNMEWNQTYEEWLLFGEMIATSDGGYAICGETGENYDDGMGLDFELVKTDASGNVGWNQTYGGEWGDGPYCLVSTSDGGYALAGRRGVSLEHGDDVWLVKTDSFGNMEWNQTYGGTSWDRALSLVETSDEGYAVVGYTESFGAGDKDFWLIKTDAYGSMEWNQTYGGVGEEKANCLVCTSDGGYLVVGYTESFGDESGDLWLIKTDEYGNVQEPEQEPQP